MTDDWFAPDHAPASQRLDSVTLGEPLWKLTKDGHAADARVRAIDGIGVELRFEWDGDLRVSQVFKTWDDLEAAATEKRRELEARGWQCRLAEDSGVTGSPVGATITPANGLRQRSSRVPPG